MYQIACGPVTVYEILRMDAILYEWFCLLQKFSSKKHNSCGSIANLNTNRTNELNFQLPLQSGNWQRLGMRLDFCYSLYMFFCIDFFLLGINDTHVLQFLDLSHNGSVPYQCITHWFDHWWVFSSIQLQLYKLVMFLLLELLWHGYHRCVDILCRPPYHSTIESLL